MPDYHVWQCNFANRIKKKGRGMGGFIIGMKKGWGNENSVILEDMGKELIVSRIEEREGKKRFT